VSPPHRLHVFDVFRSLPSAPQLRLPHPDESSRNCGQGGGRCEDRDGNAESEIADIVVCVVAAASKRGGTIADIVVGAYEGAESGMSEKPVYVTVPERQSQKSRRTPCLTVT